MLKTLRDILTPAFFRSFFGLLCVLLTTSFMNITVFRLFDGIWSGAREFTIGVGLVAFLACGLVSLFKPRFLEARAINFVAFGLLVVAAALLPIALAWGNLPLLLVGVCCWGVGRGWSTLTTGMAASRLSETQAGICITAAFFAKGLISVAAWYVPAIVSLALFFVLPAVALALAVGPAQTVLSAAAKAEPPLDLVVTQPNTFLPLGSAVFVCLFLFRLVFGFSLRFGETSGTPLMDSWSVAVVLIFAVYMLISRKSLPADMLICWSTLLVIAGFYVVATAGSSNAIVGVTLLSAGSVLIDIITWLLLVAIARRNCYGAVATFAWGHSVMSLGSIVGAQLALYSNNVAADGDASFVALSGAFIIGFAAYALFVLRKVSFNEIINNLTEAVVENPAAKLDVAAPGEEDAGNDERLTFLGRCDSIAEQYGLTKREREVMEMLARGRNRAYIEEKLVISRNTVNAHVKHVYAKLGIHSHQDLLDMVDQTCGGAAGREAELAG